MEQKQKLIVAFSVSLLIITLAIYSYISYNYYEVREMPVILEVKKGVFGFNADKGSVINFGKIPPGDMGKRSGEVVFGKKARLVMKAEGELARWMAISPNNLRLEPGKKEEITFMVSLPEEAPEGTYGGKVRFYFKRN